MWTLMVAGEDPFHLDADGELALRLHPILEPRFFTGDAGTHDYWDTNGEERSLGIGPEQLCLQVPWQDHGGV